MHDEGTSDAGLVEQRVRRLEDLTAKQRAELRDTISTAALDLWLHAESWPDLVDRCLDAIEQPDFPFT